MYIRDECNIITLSWTFIAYVCVNVLCKDGHRMHCDGEVLERLIYVILKLKRVSHQQTTPEIFLSGNER